MMDNDESFRLASGAAAEFCGGQLSQDAGIYEVPEVIRDLFCHVQTAITKYSIVSEDIYNF